MKKRLLSIVLTLALCLSLLPVTALAAEIDSNDHLAVAVREKSYEAVFWLNPSDINHDYTWSIDPSSLPNGLSIKTEQRFSDPEWCGVIHGTVADDADLKEYSFTVKATHKTDNSKTVEKTYAIVVADQVGDYYFLPSDGEPKTSGNELPVTITLDSGESVEVWSKNSSLSSSTKFTADGSDATFKYRGSEFHNNQGSKDTIELISGAVTLGAGDGVHATINGEMYTIAANDGSTATFTASTGGATISTTGGASVTFAGNTFNFTAKTSTPPQPATMTITPGTYNTGVKIEHVASVYLNGDEKTSDIADDDTYTNNDLPALYPLYIEGKQVTSANNKPTSDPGGILPTGVTYDPDNKILTLQDVANFRGTDVSAYGDHAAAIYYHGNGSGSDSFTIRLAGDSAVASGNSSTGWASAIEVVGADLTIKGNGALTVTGRDYTGGTGNYGSAGIQVTNGSLTITGDVKITAIANGNGQYNTYNHGIAAGRGITINDSAEVTATSNGNGIWLENNDRTITIGGTAKVTATGSKRGIGGNPGAELKIKDSAYVKASGGKAVDANSVSIYSGTYYIRTTTNGAEMIIQCGDFAPNWSNTTLFEMPYTGGVYDVTYDANNGTGTVPTDANSYPVGTDVTVEDAGDLTRSGYTFGGWNTKADGTGTTYQPGEQFHIGANTTLYAVWNLIPPPADDDYEEPTYRITVEETDNGEVKSNRKWAEGGTTITLTVTPEEGYALSALTVTDRRGNEIELTDKGEGVYTFRMPYRDVTVRAAFEYDRWDLGYRDCPRDHTCPYWPYTDTNTHAWYHDGVHFCVENGLMVGYGDNIFKPDNSTTRAMITVMLWRLEGSPVVNHLLDFEDVPAEAWYTEAVRWAKSEGVVEGYGNGFFGPDDDVTREQMVTILWRYAKYKGYDVSVGEDTNILSYNDALDVAEYAIPAMQWACGSGMVVGKETEDGEGMILDPKGVTTRAQMATMMMRFCAEIVK